MSNAPINGFEYVYLDKNAPRTLLMLHGTGGDENDLIPIAKELDPAANILSPRGKVLEHGMPRFFRRLAEGVFDRKDLLVRSQELAEFVKESTRIYRFALEGVIAVGYSNGANIALHLIAREPEVMRQGILIRPMALALPDTIADLSLTRVLILSGAFDHMVGAEDAGTMSQVLKDHGAQARMSVINSGHNISGEDILQAREWLFDL